MIQIERIGGILLEPIAENSWESRAVLNPAAIREGEDVHLLYRAVEGDNFSTIGYARLDRHGNVLERRSEPVIWREYDHERQGCEDPRVVFLQGKYFVLYTAYDGVNCRVAMASTEDFRYFEKHGIVGPDVSDKDAMFFPEPVNDRIIFIHRIEPDIQFAVFEDMEHFLNPGEGYWDRHLASLDDYTVMRPEFEWEATKIGGGAPPIKTEDGWLFIYHGVDKNLVYRAGVALLDLEDPYRVIARLPYPILEPDRDYELYGDVNNVVFPEGTALFEDELFVYYGAADRVIGWGKVNVPELLEELKRHKL